MAKEAENEISDESVSLGFSLEKNIREEDLLFLVMQFINFLFLKHNENHPCAFEHSDVHKL